ncbi:MULTISPECIES: DNA repair protein RecN [unclassified Bifidobacterium]|uniref:DNA repair protein RecN n=1 Tax=unclassified Bifidobacterium TaxID=2608897 RepID=UPI00112CDF32|nr:MULTISPECIES: DNA repair protein RecN [unclassified Bifidobacterium]TPF79091.1 DNA recombination protein RecN [Bifidobacterium sp. UTCIF-1]TPF80962.1 DNA recombination protein RecN [Bifidobacterium sp. UTCIF-24]TPF83241.1 DNA recombination protein RecN [Bifidobacterium sp. UTCIF-3]TPF84998.1 DNA recombination protein RecN [Bifidobacterium sp. UTCIF-36]TPF88971.1 DNA recombination protein RecN [Bifidobacterium sp. UTBIF-56]
MLEELDIRNLGPIHEATITPAPGMTAITGETGAGKSMLLSALSLISGGPADAGRVTAGADEAWTQGIFAVGDETPAAGVAHEAGVDVEDGELFLARTVKAAGRSRAVLGGKSVPKSVLANVASALVTIHGQAEQLNIASASRQREFLDHASDDGKQLEAYHAAWRALRDMDDRLERLRSQESSARQRADYLRESVGRINEVDPHPGEDEDLKVRRDRIENAADIAEGVSHALAALDSSQLEFDASTESAGASDLLLQAAQALRGIHAAGEFQELADRLESLNAELQDVVFALSKHLDEDFGDADLDALNARIHELSELTRRWGPTLADVLEWRDKASFEIEDLDASPEKIAELEAERDGLYRKTVAAADELSEARSKAAATLAGKVTAELESLAMPGASLEIRVTRRSGESEDALDANGGDDIAFLFTPYEGSTQLPMGKSASGGELSRLMLALELSAADMHTGESSQDKQDAESGMTFIFDEVDAGVGGKAAVELGRRLARLACTSQVIVVTHLAQVASWADSQFVVTKIPPDADDDAVGVITTVQQVQDDARIREVARMLSGSESEASLDHARELLADSRLNAGE